MSKSIGFGLDSDKVKSTTQSGINTSNLTIRETVRQEELTGKTAEQTKSEILTDVTTDIARENSGALNNVFDKEKVQKEIDLQMDVTKQFDANRQEAGITVGNVIKALEVTGHAIGDAKEQLALAKRVEQENQKLSLEDQLLFVNLLTELSQVEQIETNESLLPVGAIAIGEAAAMAAGTCARSPACVSAVANTLGAVGIAILNEQSEDKDKKPTPKPLPSTSGNSATGMPPEKEPDDKAVKNEEVGKQAKKLNERQISELVENPNWHKTNLKAKIIRAYNKELKGSKNFDFYRDPKTGDVFIKGNKSKNMIRINLEKFL